MQLAQKTQRISFKEEFPLQKRVSRLQKEQEKYPNNIIIIVEREEGCSVLPNLLHNRFSISKAKKLFEVHEAIRKRINEQGLQYQQMSFILTCNKVLCQIDLNVADLYQKYQDPEDGYLYVKYNNLSPF